MAKYAQEAYKIPGSTNFNELTKLEALAREYIKEGGTVCEIGSEHGRSTYLVAKVCKDMGATLFVLDIDIRCPDVLEGLPVVLKEGDSKKIYKEVPKGLDFVFIDGDHTLPTVLHDIVNMWKRLNNGGVLVAHDYRDTNKSTSEVKPVIDSLAYLSGGSVLESLWWKEK